MVAVRCGGTVMEHRQHFRYELAVDLLIYRRGLPVATGRLRNISRDGLFV